MAAAARYSGAKPTWNDVRITLNELNNLSRRLHILKENLDKFDMKVDILDDMVSALLSTLDKPSRLAVRQGATAFICSAEKLLEFAETAPAARTPTQADKLAESWGNRWEDVRQNLDTLTEYIFTICE